MAFENGKNWHYVRNGEAAGPVPGEELRRLVADGQVRRETLIWSPGLANWVDAASYADLFEGLEPAPPPLPPAGFAPVAGGAATAPLQTAHTTHGLADPGYATAAAAGYGASRDETTTSLASGPAYASDGTTGVGTASTVRYAGFWIRFVAFVIDAVVIGGITYALQRFTEVADYPRTFLTNLLPVPLTDTWQAVLSQQSNTTLRAIDRADMLQIGTMGALSLAIALIYFVIIQALLQGTIGKLILGLKLQTSRLRNVGFFRCLWRFLMMFISAAILMLGFLLAGWTRQKTALHDLLAGTRVVHRRSVR